MVFNGAMGQTRGRLPIDSLLVVQSDLIVFGQLNYADGNKLSCKLESVFNPDYSLGQWVIGKCLIALSLLTDQTKPKR
jgi:hypothetical protein